MTIENKARKFAIQRHGDQRYGDYPYSIHLDEVVQLLSNYGEIAKSIGYLHDVVEDTNTTLEEIKTNFGELIANCVSILTDEPGANRKERKTKTYKKMAMVSGEIEIALIVKAADRLANFRACLRQDNKRLLDIYKNEHSAFYKAAYRQNLCEPLWTEMEKIVNT